MKELKPHKADTITNVSEHKIKKEVKLVGRQRKVPNHILWEYNLITKELKRAEFKKMDYVLDFTKPNPAKDLLSRMKIMINKNCKYFQALNEENAWKKINNGKV
jgi:hypothetical protein